MDKDSTRPRVNTTSGPRANLVRLEAIEARMDEVLRLLDAHLSGCPSAAAIGVTAVGK